MSQPRISITRRSDLTGIEHSMELPITVEQWMDWSELDEAHVQDVFPQLTAEQREFLITGITPEEWAALVDEPEPHTCANCWNEIDPEDHLCEGCADMALGGKGQA